MENIAYHLWLRKYTFNKNCHHVNRSFTVTYQWLGFSIGEDLHGLSSLKRKQLLEDVSLLKKLKINETDSGTLTRHVSFAASYPLLVLLVVIKHAQ
jgi:hypothetical protein